MTILLSGIFIQLREIHCEPVFGQEPNVAYLNRNYIYIPMNSIMELNKIIEYLDLPES